jgi:hypothetical protein
MKRFLPLPRRLVVALVTAMCLPLACCGGGDSEPEATELVETSLLRLSDLPNRERWAVEPEATDPASEAVEREVDACERRLDPAIDSRVAERESETFARGVLDLASSTGWIVSDQADRRRSIDTLDEQLECAGVALAKALRREAPTGVSYEVEPPYTLNVETDADRTVGMEMQIGVTQAAGQQTLYLDLLAVEEGELLASYFFLHAGEMTVEDETSVIARCLDRVMELNG